MGISSKGRAHLQHTSSCTRLQLWTCESRQTSPIWVGLKLASEIRSKQEFPYLFSLGTSALNTQAILSGVSDDLRLNCWTVIFFRFDFKCPHATTAKPNADALSFGQGMFKNRHWSPHRHECTDPRGPLCADGGLA